MKNNRSIKASLLMLSLILIFSSCGIKTKAPEIQKIFTCSMCAKKGDKVFRADISCSSYNDIFITFTQPEEIKSFTVSTAQNGYSVNAFGVKNALDENDISKTSFLSILINTLKTAIYTNCGELVRNADGENYTVFLNINGMPVSAVFNCVGQIIEIKAKQTGFSAEFFY